MTEDTTIDYEQHLNHIIDNLDGVLYAIGTYRGYDLKVYVRPRHDEWRLIFRLEVPIEGEAEIEQTRSFTFEAWKDALDEFNRIAKEQNLETYGSTYQLRSIERDGFDE